MYPVPRESRYVRLCMYTKRMKLCRGERAFPPEPYYINRIRCNKVRMQSQKKAIATKMSRK